MKAALYPNFQKKNALSCAREACDVLADAGIEVAVSGDLWLKGNVDLKATFSKNLYSGDEFEWSTSDFWNINHERYDKDPQKSKKGDDENDENTNIEYTDKENQ